MRSINYGVPGPRRRTLNNSNTVPQKVAVKLLNERDALAQKLDDERALRRTQELEFLAQKNELQAHIDQLRQEHTPHDVANALLHPKAESKDQHKLMAQATLIARDLERIQQRRVVELEQSAREARTSLLCAFFELRDSLERALSATQDDPDNPWRVGIEGILNQFDMILSNEQIVRTGDVGERFDPNIHEAIALMQLENTEPGMVARVERPGFIFKEDGALIRPAQVIVSR